MSKGISTGLSKSLRTAGYYFTASPGKDEHYDYYSTSDQQLVASGDEKTGWQLLAGDEETKP